MRTIVDADGIAINGLDITSAGLVQTTAAHTAGISVDDHVVTKGYADANYGNGLDNLEDVGAGVEDTASGTGSFTWQNMRLQNNIIESLTTYMAIRNTIVPDNSEILDIGRSGFGWRDIYVNDIVLGDTANAATIRTIAAAGSAGNIAVHINTQGEGTFRVESGIAIMLDIVQSVTDTSWLELLGDNSATYKRLSTKGVSANLDFQLYPKGTGTVVTSAAHTSNIAADDDVITKGYADANYSGSGGWALTGTSTLTGTTTIDVAANVLTFLESDAATNTVVNVASFDHLTSATPANDTFGVEISLGTDTADGLHYINLQAITTDTITAAVDTTFRITGTSNNIDDVGYLEIRGEGAATNPGALILGAGASLDASANDCVVIGRAAFGGGDDSVVIGERAGTTTNPGNWNRTVIIGQFAGGGTTLNGNDAVMIGSQAKATQDDSTAVGARSDAVFESTALGTDSQALSNSSIACGMQAIVNTTSNDAIAIGHFATVAAATSGAIMMGHHSSAITNARTDSFALGWNETIPAMWIENYTALTTGVATQTATVDIPIDASSTYNLWVQIVAGEDDAAPTLWMSTVHHILAYRDGTNNVVLIDSQLDKLRSTAAATQLMDSSAAASTTNVRLTFTGPDTDTADINWRALVKMTKVASN